MKKLSPKTRFRVTFLGICVIISFCIFSYTLFSKCLEVHNNNKENDRLNELYNEKLSEEEELKSEINKLKDPEYLARYTREKYLYSAKDEIIIKIEDKK